MTLAQAWKDSYKASGSKENGMEKVLSMLNGMFGIKMKRRGGMSTDYSFLFQSMFGTKNTNPIGSFRLSQLNSGSVQAQLRAAGIDTNSKQYKAAVKMMMQNSNGAMYAKIQGIKNLMKSYDKDGDYIDPTTGLAFW